MIFKICRLCCKTPKVKIVTIKAMIVSYKVNPLCGWFNLINIFIDRYPIFVIVRFEKIFFILDDQRIGDIFTL